VGPQSIWQCRRTYQAQNATHYQTCILSIGHRGHLEWKDLAIGSGFDVKLTYDKEVVVDGTAIGLTEDFDLTGPLARFFRANHGLVASRISRIEEILDAYRDHHDQEYTDKLNVMSYGFLTDVYNRPRPSSEILKICLEQEHDSRVRGVFEDSQVILDTAYNRWLAVAESETRSWWYLFWVRYSKC
jgi:hypothetical protein